MFTFFFVENVFDKLLERLSVCPALRLSIGSCDGTRVQKSHSVRVCRQDYRVFFLSYCEKGVAFCDEIVENNILQFTGGMAWQPILWCLAIVSF